MSLVQLIGSLQVVSTSITKGPIFFSGQYIDALSMNSKFQQFFFGGWILLQSRPYQMEQGQFAYEYSICVGFSIQGMSQLTSAYDFQSLYLCLEQQALSFYVLAAFKRGSAFSTEAGQKYFIQGALSSGLLLFGISLIYFNFGTTSFEDLSLLNGFEFESVSSQVYFGLLFIGGSLQFKQAAAPFHGWIPDVYEGAPTSSVFVFATQSKQPVIVLIIRIFYSVFIVNFDVFQPLFICVSQISLQVGILGSIYQRKVKRFFAFSSITHVGFILLAFSSGSLQGIQACLLYIVIYMIMTSLSWTILLNLKNATNRGPIKYIDEQPVFAQNNKALSLVFCLLLFSMGGVPPLAGFYAKVYVFFGGLTGEQYIVGLLSIVQSVVGAFYYQRQIKQMFFSKPSFERYEIVMEKESSVFQGSLSFILIFFWVNPQVFQIETLGMSLGL